MEKPGREIKTAKDLWWEYGWSAFVFTGVKPQTTTDFISRVSKSLSDAGVFTSTQPNEIFKAAYLVGGFGSDASLVLPYYRMQADSECLQNWSMEHFATGFDGTKITTLDNVRYTDGPLTISKIKLPEDQ